METKSLETGAKYSAGRHARILAAAILLGLIASQPTFGEDVYRCPYRGGVAYTSDPTLPSCRLISLDVPQPNPKELDRLARERQQQFARELEAEQRAQTRSLVRARQLEVEAQLRWAHAAEVQAQASLNCSQYAVPLIYSSSPIYPGSYYYALPFSSYYSDPYWQRRDYADPYWLRRDP
jgi:hypothetical protein